MMKGFDNFWVNIIGTSLTYVFSLLVGFWLAPYIINHLGIALYGVIPLATTVISYLNIITLSITGSINRFLGIEIQRGDFNAANIYFNSAFWGVLAICFAIFPLGIIFSYFAPNIFNVPNGSETEVRLLFLAILVVFLLGTIQSCFAVSAWIKSKFLIKNIFVILSQLVRVVILILLFYFFAPRLTSVGASILAYGAVGFIGDLYLWRIFTPQLRINIKFFKWNYIINYLQMGGWLLVNQVGAYLFLGIDLILVNLFFGEIVSGAYGTVLLFSTLLRGLSSQIITVLTPKFVTEFSLGEIEKIKQLSFQSVRYIALLFSIPVGILSGLSKPILSVWLGESYQYLYLLLIILIIHLPINLSTSSLFCLQTTFQDVSFPGIFTVLVGLANLFATVSLVKIMGFGPISVALSSGLFLFIRNGIFNPIYASKILKTPPTKLLLAGMPGQMFALAFAATTYFLPTFFEINSWLFLLMYILILSIVFLVVLFLYLNPSEKSLLLFGIKRVISAKSKG